MAEAASKVAHAVSATPVRAAGLFNLFFTGLAAGSGEAHTLALPADARIIAVILAFRFIFAPRPIESCVAEAAAVLADTTLGAVVRASCGEEICAVVAAKTGVAEALLQNACTTSRSAAIIFALAARRI